MTLMEGASADSKRSGGVFVGGRLLLIGDCAGIGSRKQVKKDRVKQRRGKGLELRHFQYFLRKAVRALFLWKKTS